MLATIKISNMCLRPNKKKKTGKIEKCKEYIREAFIKKKKKIREIFHRWGGGVKPKKFHGFKSDV